MGVYRRKLHSHRRPKPGDSTQWGWEAVVVMLAISLIFDAIVYAYMWPFA